MITSLDHFVLLCPDVSAGTAEMQILLGRAPDWQATDAHGIHSAEFRTENTALELISPTKRGHITAQALQDKLLAQGGGLKSLVFATDDLAAAHHLLTRRGLNPGDITRGQATNEATGNARQWRRFRLDDAKTHGIKTFLIQREQPAAATPTPTGAASRLDHIVINTPNPDRALAQYGARLGLHLALDRTAEQWKTRFLFFRVGGLTFEIIHRLDQSSDPAGDDTIWGLTWTVADLPAAHARLSAAGVDVSDIRTGRKPGTTVFTARDSTLGVPTLFIAHAPR